MNILEIQSKLPWGREYSASFQANPCVYKDFQHALTHISKASGKLWTIVEEADHIGDTPAFCFKKEDIEKFLADLVICAMRMANTNPSGLINLQKAVINRLEMKNGVKL